MNSTNDSLFVVVVIVLTFAVGMATFLNYYKFQSLVGKLMQSRVMVVGNEIKDNVEKSLALGLSLQENNTLQGLIERELRSDDLIKSIVLFDTSGKVLYTTEAAQRGKVVNKSWLSSSASPARESWLVNERDSIVTGIVVKNNFGVTLGQVAISYSRKPLESVMGIMGNILMQTALVILLITTILAFSLLVLSFRNYRKELLAAEEQLTVLINDMDGIPHRRMPEEAAVSAGFKRHIAGFTQAVRYTLSELAHASETLKSPQSPS